MPVAVLGAEESWPLATKLGIHWFGSPYLPVPVWPVPLPTHYRIHYGAPIYLHHTASDADDPAVVAAAAARARSALERQLEDLRMVRRGVFR